MIMIDDVQPLKLTKYKLQEAFSIPPKWRIEIKSDKCIKLYR